jgi:hypothetical protein
VLALAKFNFIKRSPRFLSRTFLFAPYPPEIPQPDSSLAVGSLEFAPQRSRQLLFLLGLYRSSSTAPASFSLETMTNLPSSKRKRPQGKRWSAQDYCMWMPLKWSWQAAIAQVASDEARSERPEAI